LEIVKYANLQHDGTYGWNAHSRLIAVNINTDNVPVILGVFIVTCCRLLWVFISEWSKIGAFFEFTIKNDLRINASY